MTIAGSMTVEFCNLWTTGDSMQPAPRMVHVGDGVFVGFL